jgi:cytochrome P450
MSTTVTGLVFLLVSHPDVLRRAQKEIDEAFTSQVFSGTSPTYDECCRLPFVSACVREALRVMATASPRGRCSPDRSFILMGKYVPPGTAISTSPFEISTHEKLYGDNADVFVPDRWLQASEEQLRLWKTFDAHWGFGVRKCPGRHIGLMVLYKTLVLVGSHSPVLRKAEANRYKLLRQFDLKRENNAPVDSGIVPSSTFLLMFLRNL